MNLDLLRWRWIVVNSSGGKDSQTALRVVVEECDRQGVDRSRIVVSHQCLGRMEWKGTLELVKQQAAHYNLRVEVCRYRDRHGQEETLLDYVRRRRKWPDNNNRYCTSEFKRGPGGRVIVRLFREDAGSVLNIYGFRADEYCDVESEIGHAFQHSLSIQSVRAAIQAGEMPAKSLHGSWNM